MTVVEVFSHGLGCGSGVVPGEGSNKGGGGGGGVQACNF